MQFSCPHCDARIINRRNPRCEKCGNQLPAELLFTPDQIKKLEKATSEDKRRTAQFVKRMRDTTPGDGG